jgi:hypothetical protein
MKKILLIPLTLTLLISCQKFNAILIPWRVQEGHDNFAHNHAFFCDSSAYGNIDTVMVAYSVEPSGPYSVYPGRSPFVITREDETGRYYYKALNRVEP